jgi:ABC-2 type transport system ATP-binding protein
MGELEDMADHLVVIGRGRLVADTSVAALLASASRGLVRLRTAEPAQATALLTGDGATVAAAGTDALTVSGLPSERVVELLGENAVPFSEVSLQRATLEDAYMELTREAVEFRAAGAEEASR